MAQAKAHAKQGLCKCPKKEMWRCVCDCIDCKHYVGEASLSADCTFGTSLLHDTRDLEQSVFDEILLEQLIKELDALDPESRQICDFIMQSTGDTEAAKILNIPRTTFQYRKKKVLDFLRSKLE